MVNTQTPRRLSLALLCVFAPALATLRGDPTPTSIAAIPAALEPPANQTPALELTAHGVQIYECHPVAGQAGQFEWVFKAPEADLFDAQGRKVGRHFAGPSWELNDGGKVVGRIKAKADAPDGQGVPWLLLEAVQSSGGGVVGKVQSIQRVGTVGGKAPAGPVDPSKAGQEARVEYSATYRFYVAKP